MKKNQKKIILSILGIFLAILWANNTSLFADKSTQYNFLAHRGLGHEHSHNNPRTRALLFRKYHSIYASCL